jgi:hypothetical protein
VLFRSQEAAGKPLEYNAYSWNNAYHEKTNIWTGGHDFAGDTAYMDPKDIQKFLDDADNAKIADLETSLTSIRKDHGEQGTSLTKAALMQKQAFGATDKAKLDRVSAASMALGMTSDVNLNEGMGYAASMGYLEGSDEFEAATYEFANLTNREERGQKKYEAGRNAQYGSQLQNYFGASAANAGVGVALATHYGLDNQARLGNVAGGLSMISQFYGTPTYGNGAALAGIANNTNAYVGGVVTNFMAAGAKAGMSLDDVLSMGGVVSSAGMSNQQASIYDRMLGGDLMGAMSYEANYMGGDPNNRWLDAAGRSIIQTSGAAAMGVWNKWAPQVGLSAFSGSMSSQIGSFLGTSNSSIIDAFQNGGMMGLQKLSSDASYNASMASAGIAMKGIALSENLYWGADQGGTWNNPAAHSAWGIEDRQLANQDASQRANFADQWQRMTLSNDFSVQRENNQLQRMSVSQGYQQYQFSQQYQSFQQQQTWAREDWEYQDTTRNLNFGWQMEDLNEDIRFASGRQRKQLVKQRDRAALSHNLEEEQVDTQRERQDTIWKQQEEQFQKQKQYMDELAKLDQESFAINKQQRETFYKMDVDAYNRRLKEYEENKKLEDELRELQRKHQYDQLQLQKESAAVQAGAAATQKAINDAMIEGQKHWEEITGRFQQMNNYSNTFRILVALEDMTKTADSVSTYKIQKIIDLIKAIGTTDARKAGGEAD